MFVGLFCCRVFQLSSVSMFGIAGTGFSVWVDVLFQAAARLRIAPGYFRFPHLPNRPFLRGDRTAIDACPDPGGPVPPNRVLILTSSQTLQKPALV